MLSPQLRSWIEYQLEYYPENKRQLATLKESMIPSSIPKYGPQTGGFDPEQRPTENIAVRIANNDYILQLERTVNAIGSVYDRLGPSDQELVRLRYWSGNLTPEGISYRINIDKATFYYRLNNILVEIARRLGLVDI